MSTDYDLLIQNGRLVDGSGNPYYRADLAVADGRIARIDRRIPDQTAREVIDAAGRVVAPGFIDAHSHDDLYLLYNPAIEAKLLQGVTTTTIGHCGISPAPASPDRPDALRDELSLLGFDHLPGNRDLARTVSGFLDQLQAARPSINVASLVGHGTIRLAAMGPDNRTPTPTELQRMRDLAAEALEQGAFGVSTGLIYAPGVFSRTEELIEVARAVGRAGGIYATHMRNEGARVLESMDEAIEIGRRAELPVLISHHKVAGRPHWGQSVQTLERVASARHQGLDVTLDQYPYIAASTYLAATLPPDFLDGGPEIYARRLADPKVRSDLKARLSNPQNIDWENYIQTVGFEAIVIATSPGHPTWIGRSVAEIAALEDRDPFDVVFDLVESEKIATGAIYFSMDEADVRRIMAAPFTMIGSDGMPPFGDARVHPRFYGTFPRVLGRYVRERDVLTLEDAIRKMTSLPAQTYGLRGKGLLRPGFDADLVVFDPDRIMDGATFDQPARSPEGIDYVLVGGQVAASGGRCTDQRNGRVLRSGH